MQALGTRSLITTGREIYNLEGVRGLYRGGLPLILGGGMMRSAQFGVYNQVFSAIQQHFGPSNPENRWLGFLDPQVVFAGFVGGIGRGIVEGPFEYVKVRRQVQQPWKFTGITNPSSSRAITESLEIFNGSAATIFRNSFLFSVFMINVDLSKQLVPGGLSPFLTGAICSNLAWLSIWPLDVAKSQLQSGKYDGKSYGVLIRDIISSGKLFKGIVPGLTRSTLANGVSMMVYKEVERRLTHSTRQT
jgi:solute carrier family 25 (mitochondrial carnitine/acylcarnitine transporter), member 20/29